MSTLTRRGPKAGYDFPAKETYREAIWRAIAGRLGPLVPQSHVLILPSSEGAEIPILLGLGFHEDRIHAVDESAALIATAKWRAQFPRVNVYGNKLPRAMERIKERGVALAAINLDLCGPFSGPMLATIRACVQSEALSDFAIVGLTMLKGREETATVTALRLLNRSLRHNALKCDLRLDAAFREVASMAQRRIELLASGEYKSQTQRMVWGLASTTRLKFYRVVRDGSDNYDVIADWRRANLCTSTTHVIRQTATQTRCARCGSRLAPINPMGRRKVDLDLSNSGRIRRGAFV